MLAFPLLCNHRRFGLKFFEFRPLPAIMFAIALLCASVSGEDTNDGVVGEGAAANDANFSSTALFIALMTFAGITVIDGSTIVFFLSHQ